MKTFDDSKTLTYNGVQVKKLSVPGIVFYEKQEALPYDAEVEWIQSIGNNRYAMTYGAPPSISPSTATHFQIRYMPLRYNGGVTFGNSSGDDQEWRYFELSRSSVYFDLGTSRLYGSGIDLNTVYDIEFGIWPGTSTQYLKIFTVDGTQVSNVEKSLTDTSVSEDYISLFGHPNGCDWPVRVYKAKVYSGNTMIRDLIAVRKDGGGYLYDKLNGVMYGNSLTDDLFEYGPDVT